MSKFKGFNLIELMVTLGIISVLMLNIGGVIYALLQVRAKQQVYLDLTENMLLVRHFLSEDLGKAGLGSLPIADTRKAADLAINTLPYPNLYSIYSIAEDSAPLNIRQRIQAKSEVLLVQGVGRDLFFIDLKALNSLADHAIGSGFDCVSDAIDCSSCSSSIPCFNIPQEKNLLWVSDGVHTKIIAINGKANDKIAKLTQLEQSNSVNFVAGEYKAVFFYLGKTERFYPGGEPIYALYRQYVGEYSEELVAGIKDLSFEYALVLNNEIEFLTRRMVSANAAWGSVIGVKVKLDFYTKSVISSIPIDNKILSSLTLDFWLKRE